MVPNINIYTFIFCLIVTLAAGIMLFVMLNNRSKSLETGLKGAVFYGAAGYLWGGLILLNLAATLIYSMGFYQSWKKSFVIGTVIINMLLEAFFVTLALVWGIYLTNQKQKSRYRSSAIGLGYGLAQAVIMIGMPIYTSVSINMGTQIEEIDVETYSNLPLDFILASGVTWTAMIVFYAYLSWKLAGAVMDRNWKKAAVTGLSYCVGARLVRQLVALFPEGVAFYIGIIVMLAFGGVFFWMFRRELRTDL